MPYKIYVGPEPVQQYTNPTTGITWERSGSCCGCGDCCVGDPYSEATDVYCPHFVWGKMPTETVPGFGWCAGRDSPYYNAGCNVWPQDPSEIADKVHCSYVFTQIP